MKIFVYNYREFDEAEYFEKFSKEYHVELGICKEHMRPLAYCRAKWARPDCRSFKHSCFLAGDFPSKRESADFPRLVCLELLRRVKCVVHQRHQSQRNRNPEDDSVQRQ